MTPSITQDAIDTALGNFLQTVLGLPNGQIVVGQANRVSSPEGDYCAYWPLRRPRLSTNVDTSADCKFTGSISGTVMTVSAIDIGTISAGAVLFGIGVTANTTVTGPVTVNPDGTGTYQVSPSQTLASTALSAGQTVIEQSTEVVYQVDVHGPASGDNAQAISTAFRDEYGVRLFAGTGVTPLYCEDPRQLPFTTAADQFEDRWSIDVHMQADPSISVPQEYYDAATVTTINVDAAYPA
jgi:hypothetical protein